MRSRLVTPTLIATLGLIVLASAPTPAEASTRAVITGTVSDAFGHPIADAMIDFHGGGEREVATTDAKGRYRLRVKARAITYFDVFHESPVPSWTSGNIDLTEDGSVVRDVQLSAPPATVLYGRVTDAKTGRGVKNFPIYSSTDDDEIASTAWTDRDGWYAFTEYRLRDDGYFLMPGNKVYALGTLPTPKYGQVRFLEEGNGATGPGIAVPDETHVRFDFTLPRHGAASGT